MDDSNGLLVLAGRLVCRGLVLAQGRLVLAVAWCQHELDTIEDSSLGRENVTKPCNMNAKCPCDGRDRGPSDSELAHIAHTAVEGAVLPLAVEGEQLHGDPAEQEEGAEKHHILSLDFHSDVQESKTM